MTSVAVVYVQSRFKQNIVGSQQAKWLKFDHFALFDHGFKPCSVAMATDLLWVCLDT